MLVKTKLSQNYSLSERMDNLCTICFQPGEVILCTFFYKIELLLSYSSSLVLIFICFFFLYYAFVFLVFFCFLLFFFCTIFFLFSFFSSCFFFFWKIQYMKEIIKKKRDYNLRSLYFISWLYIFCVLNKKKSLEKTPLKKEESL